MRSFKIAPTRMAEWHGLITDAKAKVTHQIDESLECYLIITLDEFTTEMSYISRAIAFDYLNALDIAHCHNHKSLRHVGDKCLIITGLFPEQVDHRNVSVDYYIGMGQHAYHSVADAANHIPLDSQLFIKLGNQFTDLMDILRVVRFMPIERLVLNQKN